MNTLRLPYVNRVFITGRLTRDPEVRYTPSGHAVASLPVAINRPYKDAGGAWKEETCFLTVVAWDRQAELSGEQLKKGSAIFVEGRLTGRVWETPEGQKRQVIELRADRVQFLDKPAESESQPGGETLTGESPGTTELPF